MAKKNIKKPTGIQSSSAIELLSWPDIDQEENFHKTSSYQKIKTYNVIAYQTNRFKTENKLLEINTNPNDDSPYANFNLGLHVGDDVKSVVKNRKYLLDYLEVNASENKCIQWLEQVHGNHVAEITVHSEQSLIADASITRKKNIALAIMTADCLPILLCNTQGTEIAAIHGGWRPLVSNIIKNTIAKMHSDIGELHAWLGPCIGKEAFEVGEEVKLAFTRQNANFAKAFVQQNDGKYLADLHLIATLQFTDLGVTKITSLAECTFTRPDKYYSYRRDSITGRMATIISLS